MLRRFPRRSISVRAGTTTATRLRWLCDAPGSFVITQPPASWCGVGARRPYHQNPEAAGEGREHAARVPLAFARRLCDAGAKRRRSYDWAPANVIWPGGAEDGPGAVTPTCDWCAARSPTPTRSPASPVHARGREWVSANGLER